MNKFLLVHAGARDNYLLYRALYENNLLDVFVTDFAHSFPWLHKRYVPNNGSVKIKNSYKLHRRNHFDYSMNDLMLSRLAGDLAVEGDLAIFAYSYYASEAFLRNEKNKNYLFQLHPHPLLIREVLLKSLVDYPEYEKLVMEEDEFQKSYFHLDRECDLAGQVFCASTFTKKSLQHYDRNLDVRVVPYDIPKVRAERRTIFNNALRKENKKLRVLFVGQLTFRKGIVPMCRALKKFKNIELNIITKSANYGIFQKEFSGLDIKFHPNLSDINKFYLMSSVDFGILPSYIEGFGHVISEFASIGIPIITSVNTGSPDIFQKPLTDLILHEITENNIVNIIERIVDNLSFYKEEAHRFAVQLNDNYSNTFSSKLTDEITAVQNKLQSL